MDERKNKYCQIHFLHETLIIMLISNAVSILLFLFLFLMFTEEDNTMTTCKWNHFQSLPVEHV